MTVCETALALATDTVAFWCGHCLSLRACRESGDDFVSVAWQSEASLFPDYGVSSIVVLPSSLSQPIANAGIDKHYLSACNAFQSERQVCLSYGVMLRHAVLT